MYINEDEILAAKLNPKKVLSVARRLSLAAIDAQNMGITIFGGSGSGSLRFTRKGREGALVLAKLDGPFDGGDGQEVYDDSGLLRGE